MMNSLRISLYHPRLRYATQWLSFSVHIILLLGCASINPVQDDVLIKFEGNPEQPKSIFVFLDGTANDRRDTTNVWRLFEQVKLHKNPQTVGRYIPGVGSIEDPLDDDPEFAILGDALGKGMEPRIEAGYEFISTNYRPGDNIYLFGFSRGAHQARSIAGVLAYAGIPLHLESNRHTKHKALNRIIDSLKDIHDEDFIDHWKQWKPNQSPPLAQLPVIEGADMQPVEITLLGVWDTVPGSSFKKYSTCKETIGFFKRNASGLPLISEGQRYKSDSYPPIRRILHAIAADEKRTKFMPLYLCPPIASEYTTTEEIWFAGAHAYVGGGYGDTELPSISLAWMMERLKRSYKFASEPEAFTGHPKGLAHWSYGDGKASLGSECKSRMGDANRQPPLGYRPHQSIEERRQAGNVPILINGVRREQKYPLSCANSK